MPHCSKILKIWVGELILKILQDHLVIFSAPVVRSTIFLQSSGFLYWNQDLVPMCASCYWSVIAARPSQSRKIWQLGNINTHIWFLLLFIFSLFLPFSPSFPYFLPNFWIHIDTPSSNLIPTVLIHYPLPFVRECYIEAKVIIVGPFIRQCEGICVFIVGYDWAIEQ